MSKSSPNTTTLEVWPSKAENNLSCDDLKSVLLTIDDPSKSIIIENWIAKNTEQLTMENFRKLFAFFGNDVAQKTALSQLWLNSLAPDSIEKIKTLVYVTRTNSLFNSSDLSAIVSFLTKINSKETLLPNFCLSFIDEKIREHFTIECLNQGILKTEDLRILRQIISSFINDENARNVIAATSDVLKINRVQIAFLAQKRFAKYYQIVTNILKQEPLETAIKSDVIAEIKENFGEKIRTDELFSFFDIQSNASDFLKLLTPEFQAKLTKIKLPQNLGYIKKEEHLKLQQLSANSSEYGSVAELCAYFQSKVGPKPELTEEYVAQNPIKLSEAFFARQEEINLQFQKLLKMPPDQLRANCDELANFLGMLVGNSNLATETDDKNKIKLCEFFYNSKERLVQLFAQEQGTETLENCLFALNQGCAANIGNQVHLALYHSLITDINDRIIYSYFAEKIFTNIVNENSDDLMNIHHDPLQNPAVLSAIISPLGFFNGIAKQLKNPYDFLVASFNKTGGDEDFDFGVNKFRILRGLVDQKYGDDNKKLSEIAAYLAMKHSIPGFLEHSDLREFKEHFQEFSNILAKADETHSQQQKREHLDNVTRKTKKQKPSLIENSPRNPSANRFAYSAKFKS